MNEEMSGSSSPTTAPSAVRAALADPRAEGITFTMTRATVEVCRREMRSLRKLSAFSDTASAEDADGAQRQRATAIPPRRRSHRLIPAVIELSFVIVAVR